MTGVALDVGIVGAGVAGLTTAIGLCRAGHNVEIFERSKLASEIGAAIHICPNATRVLRQWDFDFIGTNAIMVNEGRVISPHDMKISFNQRYPDLESLYGAPWYFIHRVDLHNELQRLAKASGPGFKGATLHLASEVKSLDCEEGLITLTDGRRFKKDLVIAADGVHSTTASLVLGDKVPAHECGQSAFRFMVPTQTINAAGLGDALFTHIPDSVSVAADSQRRLVWYPCRNGELQNFVAIHPTRVMDHAEDKWNVSANLDSLLDEYKSFHPDLIKAMTLATDLKLWKLLFRPPISTWHRGKVVLAGDAAHPMLPHQGQGGAQAIEDGGALAILLENLSSQDDVPKRLRMYQEIRWNRTAAMQIFSKVGQDQAEKIELEAKKYTDGPIPKNQIEFHDFNFGYDIIAACQSMLATGC
ncbi:putative salicylate hydroxylase [Xylariaceae sp. FL0255]|nr:putative salicylate hydroxylase [Xylariaceae sp. FL0255]